MEIAEEQIAAVVKRVVARIAAHESASPNIAPNVPANAPARTVCEGPASHTGVFDTMDEAVAAARAAYEALDSMPIAVRDGIIQNMRTAALERAQQTARMAVDETGLGRVEHKLIKNRLAILRTPGTEILKTEAVSGDNGLTITERAPYGVIGSITPCTNPTATIISNSIGMIAGGNSVVINAHPTAKEVTLFNVRYLNEAIIEAGGPPNLISTVAKPTIATANELMKHPGIALLVVTGGPAVVKVAMGSGKKVIAAGPGNPPAVVDETADLGMAAKHIVDGASFDNNIVCVLEKEIIAVDSIADELLKRLEENGAYILNRHQVRRLEKIVIDKLPTGDPDDHGMVNKNWIGKDAELILKEIDVHPRRDVRLIVADLPKEHPFVQMELLMPLIGLVRVKDVDEAIATAQEVEHGFRHTATMHSRNIENLSKMARVINTSIFVKNGPSTAGLGFHGEGYTSFTIASPTGEGITNARHFTRERRCTLKDSFRII